MSIICYTGLPGDGKSYSAVQNVVIPALKEGRIVAHNLDLNLAALNVVTGRDCEKLLVQLGRDWKPQEIVDACPPGAVIILDEVWRYWPAGIKANEVPQDELKFFKEHRHRVGDDGLATEILIIDQDPATGIPKFLRSLVQLTYIHTKLDAIGAKGRFRVEVYTRCQPADKPAKSAHIRSLQGKYVPEVWNCYVSHTQAKKVGEAGLERAVDRRASILKGYTMKAAICGAIALPFIAVWVVNSFQAMGAKGAATPQAIAARDRAPAPNERSELEPVHEPEPERTVYVDPEPTAIEKARKVASEYLAVESDRWTLLGVVHKSDGSGLAMVRTSLGVRHIPADRCRNPGPEWECWINGRMITVWTGATWRTSVKVDPMGSQ